MVEAMALLDDSGRVCRLWGPGGEGDQPADLWRVVRDVAKSVRAFKANK